MIILDARIKDSTHPTSTDKKILKCEVAMTGWDDTIKVSVELGGRKPWTIARASHHFWEELEEQAQSYINFKKGETW